MLDKTVYSNTNWAPRIGFAFDADRRRQDRAQGALRPVLRGDPLRPVRARAARAGTDYVGYTYDPAGDDVRAAGQLLHRETAALLYPIYGVDPDMKHPRVDEWTAGIERELTKDVRLSLTGIWRQDKNIQASVYPDARWTPTTVTNGLTGQPLTVYNWANRRPRRRRRS